MTAGKGLAGWEPIETVPKDGTKVLVGRFVPKCSHGKNGWVQVDYWHSSKKSGYTGLGEFNEQCWPATHWQPLPAPPAHQEAPPP